MTSDIVVTKINITRSGELNFFQVNIPKDVVGITGIQTGILGVHIPGDGFGDKNHVGSIKLQAETPANMCYCCEVYFGSGTLENTLTGFDTASGDMVNLFTFPFASGSSSGVETTMIRNTHTIYGCYEDILGKQLGRDVPYTIGLYLWTNSNIEK
jgi:hypothetical protein